jgi:3',5'-cyclic-AMP phosphodiesterase
MRLLPIVVALAGCLRPGEDRARLDLEVGRAASDGLAIEVDDGLAHVRAVADRTVVLWAQAPVLRIAVDVEPDAAGQWRFTFDNVVADAALTAESGGAPVLVVAAGGARPTRRSWEVFLPPGRTMIQVAPPDADDLTRWRFAAMADIQDALPIVDQVFARINAQPDLRFVISMGDIVQRGHAWEYELFEEQLTRLDLPYYSTIGNHELFADPARWAERFGRLNVHFTFRGVSFSLIDSGDATIDPLVDGWLDDWLDAAADRIHVFGTHYPPIDPVGVRGGSFASQREALRLLARLAAGNVDLTLYGHIHTHSAFDNAGIPAHITGGGGADPQRLDHIGRHFLVVEAAPAEGRIANVQVVEVD